MSDKASPPVPGAASPAAGATPPTPGLAPEGTEPPRRSADEKPPEERPFPSPAKNRTSLTLDDVGPLWDSFRAGSVVPCPGDAGSLALSVDGNNAYRLVCCRCGTASSWFEAAPAGIRLRTIPPGPDDDSADI